MDNRPLWPHQAQAIVDVKAAIDAGKNRICLASPTGAGKSRIVCELIREWSEKDLRTVLYSNRVMLIDQLRDVLSSAGIDHGVRSAGHEDERWKMVQISSLQTEHSRRKKAKAKENFYWELHDAQRIVIDEVHINRSDTVKKIADEHVAAGAVAMGITATPIDLAHMFDHLIVAGNMSDCRRCGALVPAYHYGPDEPDTKKIRKHILEFSENDIRKVMMVQGIFGRVLKSYREINPDQRPSLLFAPGVPESIWFAEEFQKAGIKAAHIDGDSCWIDGEIYKSSTEVRDQIRDGSKCGDIKVICNRFVLREGISWNWLSHGILATIFGSLQTYLQSLGRLLRAAEGKPVCTIQDHGGSWHRFGSVNSDRTWNLETTESQIAGIRDEHLRSKKCCHCGQPCSGVQCGSCGARNEMEAMRCPRCSMILTSNICKCGCVISHRTRPVVQSDGKLKQYTGEIYVPRLTRMRDDTVELWTRMYYRARKANMTFAQARGLFFYESHYYPPEDLPFMPTSPRDWYKKVANVPEDRLTYVPEKKPKHLPHQDSPYEPSLFQ